MLDRVLKAELAAVLDTVDILGVDVDGIKLEANSLAIIRFELVVPSRN